MPFRCIRTFGYRIVTRSAPRVAAADPARGERGATERSETLDRLDRLVAARRPVSAVAAEPRRQHELIRANRGDHRLRGRAADGRAGADRGLAGHRVRLQREPPATSSITMPALASSSRIAWASANFR